MAQNELNESDKNSEAIDGCQQRPCSASGVLPDGNGLVEFAKNIVNNNESEKIGQFYRELLRELFTDSNASKLNRAIWDASLCVETVIVLRSNDRLSNIPEFLKDYDLLPTTLN